jgi:hypothetical protein
VIIETKLNEVPYPGGYGHKRFSIPGPTAEEEKTA